MRPDMDEEFLDYGDDYDDEDEDYGSQSNQRYLYEQAVNAGLLEGSGGSGEYDDEDISDESEILKQQLIAQQMAAAKQA